MKLAVFRYDPTYLVMGQVDAEGEAVMLGLPLPPEHPENRPHEYTPQDGGPVLETGTLCECGRPRGHQIHAATPRHGDDPDDADAEALGPIVVRLYDPVEVFTSIVQAATELGQAGFAVVKVPQVWPASTLNAHYDRMLLDGVYALDAEGGEEREPIVNDYFAYRQSAPAPAIAEPRGGRRRIVTH